MPSIHFPAFPDDVPTHPLLVVDYSLLLARDPAEIDKLWGAAKNLGFWYLKNHGADDLAEGIYKAAGANAVDATGQPDTVEFINIAKDDAIAWPEQARRAYPSTVNAHMSKSVTPFIFNDKLQLPADALMKRHTLEEYSGSETRIAIGAHTDFGTLSFLHNRLGGLQVLVPGSEDWQYIKPPPGAQSQFERWSLVYFTRPGNDVTLRALAVTRTPDKNFETGCTSLEWFTRRIKNQRMRIERQACGPETWMNSRGTEHRVAAV
ncbi:hypothetical protein B0H17DRAFT_1162879 [Mycena rosella]|uniref:Clavaminate synthase-like protein n=1 Tax=Mycena rosella TaxID=1033263 RepID=A0AAD7CTS2_MYCRO|nr:hypothetical protein B0H17DRAFT_1162879 [Mycena rosella]